MGPSELTDSGYDRVVRPGTYGKVVTQQWRLEEDSWVHAVTGKVDSIQIDYDVDADHASVDPEVFLFSSANANERSVEKATQQARVKLGLTTASVEFELPSGAERRAFATAS